MKSKTKAKPSQPDFKKEIAALKAENRKLNGQVAKIKAESFSLKAQVTAMDKELKKVQKEHEIPDLGARLRRAQERTT